MITPKDKVTYHLKRQHQRFRDLKELFHIYRDRNIFNFISFPKSGRTWVRLFLNHYFFILNPFSVTSRDDAKYYRTIPIIHYRHGQYKNLDAKKIDAATKRLKNKQVILMIRDPRDIFISYYFQLTKRKDPAKRLYAAMSLPPVDWLSVPIGELLTHPYFGINWIIQHLNLWYGALDSFKRAHLIQYENIMGNPHHEFSDLLAFILQGDVNRLALDKAVEETRFNKMKENEKNRLHAEVQLTARSTGDEDTFKVRRGKVGGYKDYLSREELQYVSAAMDRLHPELQSRYY